MVRRTNVRAGRSGKARYVNLALIRPVIRTVISFVPTVQCALATNGRPSVVNKGTAAADVAGQPPVERPI